jgi:hypothetical protein
MSFILRSLKYILEQFLRFFKYLYELNPKVQFNAIFYPVVITAYILLFEYHGLVVASAVMVGMVALKMTAEYLVGMHHRATMSDTALKSQHAEDSKIAIRLEIMGLALMTGLTLGSYFMDSDFLLQLKPIIDNAILIGFVMLVRAFPEKFLGTSTSLSQRMFSTTVKNSGKVVEIDEQAWKYCDYLSILDSVCGLTVGVAALVMLEKSVITEEEWFFATTIISKIPSVVFMVAQIVLVTNARTKTIDPATQTWTEKLVSYLTLPIFKKADNASDSLISPSTGNSEKVV